jgi:nicotinate-nucleotide adenylyltransferase
VRIGILGGTFDPIHVAHLHAAETALYQANLDRLLFMPAGDPWQKGDRDVSDKRHRTAMVRLAIEGVPGFHLDLREVEREGSTYTADTLATFGDDDDLFLLMGADAAIGFDTWYQPERVLGRAGILIVPRPGSDSEAALEAIPSARILDMAAFDVSSTLIRSMARTSRPFRYLVTGGVYNYIRRENLYTDTQSDDMVGETTTEESSS